MTHVAEFNEQMAQELGRHPLDHTLPVPALCVANRVPSAYRLTIHSDSASMALGKRSPRLPVEARCRDRATDGNSCSSGDVHSLATRCNPLP